MLYLYGQIFMSDVCRCLIPCIVSYLKAWIFMESITTMAMTDYE